YENGVETEVPSKTTQALLARQRERKAKSILLLAIPDEYQLRSHTIKDAKSLWAAIKSRFSGNVESKTMQKTVLKQQFENFSVSDTEGPDKAYDRIQKFISLLEVHGETVSNEDANQKFLRALPSSWNNIALIMRNKEGIDELDIDDLYNNLKVFEADIKDCNFHEKRMSTKSVLNDMGKGIGQREGNLQQALKYKEMFDSGCSKHMTGNKALLTNYQHIDGGFVAFGGSTKGGKIIGRLECTLHVGIGLTTVEGFMLLIFSMEARSSML
nr:ribonuclease H-like domain-containing protein [Tanacetum cinerariifolium]